MMVEDKAEEATHIDELNQSAEPTHDELDGNGVKEKSKDQREALPGEPKCVVCGCYGEYICDETDDDICSLECKQTLLQRFNSKRPSQAGPPPKRTPAIDDCFYVRDSENSSSNDQSELLRCRLEIHVKGGNLPAPVLSFSSGELPPKLLQNLETSGYDMPTPVQMQAIPSALARKNLLVSADTGSGKTASFLVPIITRCARFRSEHPSDKKNPLAIVLTPTRELCIQVEQQAKILGKGLPFKTGLVVGGDPMAGQLYRIQKGVELIIGTPGRLIDLLMKNEIELDEVNILVLDEVDCMLQRGFRDQVLQIYTALSQPQILMFSATISQDIEKVGSSLAKDITTVSVGSPNKPTKSVKQLTIWVESNRKKQKLFDILRSKQHFTPPAVVYVSSRIGADLLADAITVTTGIKAVSIHGEKSMKERREIMESFLVGNFSVIVSTGILGRGVDLIGVKQVVVFDMPNSMKEYIHQIGRASRMGEAGTAILFVNEENRNLFPELVETLRSSRAPIPRELLNSRYVPTGLTSKKWNGSKKRKVGY